MILLEVLSSLSPVVTITANVTILSYTIPAFKRTRNRAFLYLGFAALLGTFDTVCDFTVGIDLFRKAHAEYVTYRTFRKFTYFADCALDATGIALLARGAMRKIQSGDPAANDPGA